MSIAFGKRSLWQRVRPVFQGFDLPLIGIIELVGTLLYAWRRTSVLGAVAMTAAGAGVPSHLML